MLGNRDNRLVVKVCDAIMGSGKSQAAIRYMNEHPDQKFVYVTPYLAECERIVEACPALNFVEPEQKSRHRYSKLEHTAALLKRGENISTTHTAFKFYTPDMLESIREHRYTLIIDEALEVFQEAKVSRGDLEMLHKLGCMKGEDGRAYWDGSEYTGVRLRDVIRMLQSSNLMTVGDDQKEPKYFFWTIAPNVFHAFSEVIILTYLFECQDFWYYLKINNVPYKYIGIHRDEGEGPDVYRFVDEPDYVPEYVHRIREVLHVCEEHEMNRYASDETALSTNWCRSHRRQQEYLRRHMNTFCRSRCKAKAKDLMWSCYKSQEKHFDTPGFRSNMVPFNTKASNEYRDRFALAYMLNAYQQPWIGKYLEDFGLTYDNDGYALSNMIQWIWRSAIRDGKEVWLYLPSSRMRRLLNEWMDRLECGDTTWRRRDGIGDNASASGSASGGGIEAPGPVMAAPYIGGTHIFLTDNATLTALQTNTETQPSFAEAM